MRGKCARCGKGEPQKGWCSMLELMRYPIQDAETRKTVLRPVCLRCVVDVFEHSSAAMKAKLRKQGYGVAVSAPPKASLREMLRMNLRELQKHGYEVEIGAPVSGTRTPKKGRSRSQARPTKGSKR